MWADATRAEAFRLIHSRTTWFWSVVFLPILTLVMGVGAAYFMKAHAERLVAGADTPPELQAMLVSGPMNLGESLLQSAGNLAGPGLLLFTLIGAATVYAGDYRWETWRLLRPRNGRIPLVVGKVLVVTGLSLIAMVVLTAATMTSEAIRGVIFDRTLGFSLNGEQTGALFGLWGLAALRVSQFRSSWRTTSSGERSCQTICDAFRRLQGLAVTESWPAGCPRGSGTRPGRCWRKARAPGQGTPGPRRLRSLRG